MGINREARNLLLHMRRIRRSGFDLHGAPDSSNARGWQETRDSPHIPKYVRGLYAFHRRDALINESKALIHY